eukprot:TRINITY_DN1475_c0_g2_i1.p1 TRINITY_DN1475_c0_g2~~TRINITY_DN1475_c0_g2_i1.p1  ORF type:complete len:358 (+),score=79.61 TRINITY_DN1475_c0_g2_i1:128-1075(+)
MASLESPLTHCGTTDVYQWKQRDQRLHAPVEVAATTCKGEGRCDDPAIRNATKLDQKTIMVNWHIAASSSGEMPDGFSPEDVEANMDVLKQQYLKYGIKFEVNEVFTHKNDAYYCLPEYSGSNPSWYYALMDMKAEFAVSPKTNLNIFVSCMDRNFGQGTLGGIGTFPWDADALTTSGGLWVNAITVNKAGIAARDTTLAHELGHNLGLWHTFHGVTEISFCGDPCFEAPHDVDEDQYDLVGDFCADTLSTPMNFQCAPPTDRECKYSFGETDYTNIMGYSQLPVPCTNKLSESQQMRAHCWVCDAIGSQVQGCE